ncbi:MAG TPA: TetR/AcrR family transcriptional regulator [Dongiaceae bacterium]|nr:TetR/AcrR family transcriptional regulator [Dongiaceae bacterium]
MARPRGFDEGKVLEAAGGVFWRGGYEATSTRELSAATGLTASSLYAAFGDKQTLFRRALDSYLDRILHERMQRLSESVSPARAITAFFHEIIERSVSDQEQRGCMLVNSAVEASPRDAHFRAALAAELALIENFFRDRFIAAQRSGEIPVTHSADDAASQLLALLLGIRVLARVRPERELLTAALRQTLKLLDLPPLPKPGSARFAD